MQNNKKNLTDLANLPVIYEVVEPALFTRSCIHCTGQSCWCIIKNTKDNEES